MQANPAQLIHEARQIAQQHGMFIVELKDGNKPEPDYVLYRRVEPRNARLGRRNGAKAMRQLVKKCAGAK